MMQIIFVNKIDKRQENIKYIYLEYLNNKTVDFDLQDLKKLINLKYDLWLNEAKNFHDKISIYFLKKNKNWWLADSSRFIIWKTKSNYNLNNYFYSKAILEIAKKYDKVIVVGKNNIVEEYIKSNLENNKKKINLASISKYSYLKIFKISILALFSAIKYFIILLKQFRKKIPKHNSILVSSLSLNKKIIKEKGDHFFGEMINSKKYLWVYNDYPNKISEIKKTIDLNNKSYFFIIEFGSLKLILKSLFSFWKFQYDILSKKNLFIRTEIKSNFWFVFFNEFYYKKILYENIFFEIYLLNLYTKILNNTCIDKIILPYEENGWERSILIGAKKRRITTLGYAHAAHSQGHKYYFSISKEINPPRPDKILTTGKIATQKFIEMDYKTNNLITLGSDKYHEKISNIYNFGSKKKNLLFMCGVGLEIVNFAKLLKDDEVFFKKYNFIIRENPHSWAEEHSLARKIFGEKNIEYQISKKNFQDEILNSKYVIYETSTAGLEGILMGRIGIQINVTDNIYSNQFHNINDSKIKYCMNIKELNDLVNYYETLDEKTYMKLVDEQISQVCNLIEKKNLSAIDKIENFL